MQSNYYINIVIRKSASLALEYLLQNGGNIFYNRECYDLFPSKRLIASVKTRNNIPWHVFVAIVITIYFGCYRLSLPDSSTHTHTHARARACTRSRYRRRENYFARLFLSHNIRNLIARQTIIK